jgi:tyrosine-protein phosphatase SIW14
VVLPLNRSLIVLFVVALPALAGPSFQGIDNFYQVNDRVYRGAQPTSEGFQYLAKIGVKTVLDLRENDRRSSAEEKVVTALGMQYVNVPMTGLAAPTASQTSQILSLLEGNSAGPVFVHCKRGADRTGAVIAAYRIDHDRWDNARALREALSCGMSFFQIPRQRYIRNFQPRMMEATAKPVAANAPAPVAPAAALPAPAMPQ